MKALFDESSFKVSKLITNQYSTSFSLGIYMLCKSIRPAIYSIYGFVRYADEIVDSFHDYDKETLLSRFISDYHTSLEETISLNPILNSFQEVVNKFHIKNEVEVFLDSMKMDLKQSEYSTREEYENYINGSADVVGLMCLKVFVAGDEQQYEALKPAAKKLGSAFQKVNFLRDFNFDMKELGRSYFPNVDVNELNDPAKDAIIKDIEKDFSDALVGIKKLPKNCRLGVFVAYKYYAALLKKLKFKSTKDILQSRIRIPNYLKGYLLIKAYLRYKTNVL